MIRAVKKEGLLNMISNWMGSPVLYWLNFSIHWICTTYCWWYFLQVLPPPQYLQATDLFLAQFSQSVYGLSSIFSYMVTQKLYFSSFIWFHNFQYNSSSVVIHIDTWPFYANLHCNGGSNRCWQKGSLFIANKWL